MQSASTVRCCYAYEFPATYPARSLTPPSAASGLHTAAALSEESPSKALPADAGVVVPVRQQGVLLGSGAQFFREAAFLSKAREYASTASVARTLGVRLAFILEAESASFRPEIVHRAGCSAIATNAIFYPSANDLYTVEAAAMKLEFMLPLWALSLLSLLPLPFLHGGTNGSIQPQPERRPARLRASFDLALSIPL